MNPSALAYAYSNTRGHTQSWPHPSARTFARNSQAGTLHDSGRLSARLTVMFHLIKLMKTDGSLIRLNQISGQRTMHKHVQHAYYYTSSNVPYQTDGLMAASLHHHPSRSVHHFKITLVSPVECSCVIARMLWLMINPLPGTVFDLYVCW